MAIILNKWVINWFTAVLAGLVLASAITILNPPINYTHTPEEAKAALANYGEQWEQQHNLSLAELYEGLAEYSVSQAQANAPTGYPIIDDAFPSQDEFYQQAAQYREQAAQYRALVSAE